MTDETIRRMADQVDALREALGFYADPRRYNGPNQRCTPFDKFTAGDLYMKDVTRDGGQIARDALAQTGRELVPCRFCGKQPGEKVGPPAMARCVTDDCEGSNLAATLKSKWNAQNHATSTTVTPGAALLAQAKAVYDEMTPEQKRVMRRAQRKSWLVGELMLQHPEMTREEAVAIYDRVGAEP